jgi:hypothetical protein
MLSYMKTNLAVFALLTIGCAHARLDSPELSPLRFEAAGPPAPKVLDENHFVRDQSASISEEGLREILAAPVFLEADARLGVVPVSGGYALSAELPAAPAPGALADALEESNLFALSSEISTDWPVDRGLPGLRELGARYRDEYLLLYRARFADQSYANGWAWLYPTIIGAFVAPGTTVERAGVLEATLYDVKTGTILFTVQERVHGEEKSSPPMANRHSEELERRLIAEAVPRLADQVLAKCRRLASSRPGGVQGHAEIDLP